MVQSETCRICFEQSLENNDLIQPCRCTGTMALVHRSCLNTWRMTSAKSDAFLSCDICHTPYSFIDQSQSRQRLQNIARALLPMAMFLVVIISGYIMKVVDICISRDYTRLANLLQINRIHMLYGVLLPSAFGLGPFCSLINIGMPHVLSFCLHELSIDTVIQVAIEIFVFTAGVLIGSIRTSSIMYDVILKHLESRFLEPLTIFDRKVAETL